MDKLRNAPDAWIARELRGEDWMNEKLTEKQREEFWKEAQEQGFTLEEFELVYPP